MTFGVVLFGAEWCRPCKQTAPHLEKVCAELDIALDYVDVETYDERARDVTAVPTIRVYDEHAEIVRERRGGMRESEIRTFLGGLSEPKRAPRARKPKADGAE